MHQYLGLWGDRIREMTSIVACLLGRHRMPLEGGADDIHRAGEYRVGNGKWVKMGGRLDPATSTRSILEQYDHRVALKAAWCCCGNRGSLSRQAMCHGGGAGKFMHHCCS